MSDLTLSHSHAEGTLLYGTSKGDGSAEVLRGRPGLLYWKWSRREGFWFVPHSRDSLPRRGAMAKVAEALRAAGFEVDVEVDAELRSIEEVEADRRERAGERAEGLAAKAERHASRAEDHWKAEHDLLDPIPPGQPILLGHHSQRRHERTLERAHAHMEHAAEHHRIAKDAARRAEVAAQTATGARSRRTISNKVATLAAEVARDLRTLHGYWRRWGETQTWVYDEEAGRHVLRAVPIDPESPRGLELVERITYATEQRLHWRAVLDALAAAEGGGEAVDVSAVRKGDLIRLGRGLGPGSWHRVVRVNPKSFSIPSGLYEGHTLTYRKDEVTGHRNADGTPVGGSEAAAEVELDSPADGAPVASDAASG